MRTYGRTYDDDGIPAWVKVQTADDGSNDLVYVTALIQTLKLNLNESPFYANYGLPYQQTIMTQIFPDFYVARTQQQYAQFFASLLISKRSGTRNPTYDVSITTHQGVKLKTSVSAQSSIPV